MLGNSFLIEIHHNCEFKLNVHLKFRFRGKMEHSLIGVKSSIGKDLRIPYKPNLAVPVTLRCQLFTVYNQNT